MTDTTTRQLWREAKPKPRMIAVGVAFNGGAFAVMSEGEPVITDAQKEEEADIAALLNYAG